MKTAYGSHNGEEEVLVRRTVVPPLAPSRAKRAAASATKKRIAIGASIALLGVAATCGYIALNGQRSSTPGSTRTVSALSLEAAALAESVGDQVTFDSLDLDRDGRITKDEYLSQLSLRCDQVLAKLNGSNLASDIKTPVAAIIQDNFEAEASCVANIFQQSGGDVIDKDTFTFVHPLIQSICKKGKTSPSAISQAPDEPMAPSETTDGESTTATPNGNPPPIDDSIPGEPNEPLIGHTTDAPPQDEEPMSTQPTEEPTTDPSLPTDGPAPEYDPTEPTTEPVSSPVDATEEVPTDPSTATDKPGPNDDQSEMTVEPTDEPTVDPSLATNGPAPSYDPSDPTTEPVSSSTDERASTNDDPTGEPASSGDGSTEKPTTGVSSSSSSSTATSTSTTSTGEEPSSSSSSSQSGTSTRGTDSASPSSDAPSTDASTRSDSPTATDSTSDTSNDGSTDTTTDSDTSGKATDDTDTPSTGSSASPVDTTGSEAVATPNAETGSNSDDPISPTPSTTASGGDNNDDDVASTLSVTPSAAGGDDDDDLETSNPSPLTAGDNGDDNLETSSPSPLMAGSGNNDDLETSSPAPLTAGGDDDEDLKTSSPVSVTAGGDDDDLETSSPSVAPTNANGSGGDVAHDHNNYNDATTATTTAPPLVAEIKDALKELSLPGDASSQANESTAAQEDPVAIQKFLDDLQPPSSENVTDASSTTTTQHGEQTKSPERVAFEGALTKIFQSEVADHTQKLAYANLQIKKNAFMVDLVQKCITHAGTRFALDASFTREQAVTWIKNECLAFATLLKHDNH